MRSKKYSAQSRIIAKIIKKLANPYGIALLLIFLILIFHKTIASLVILIILMGVGVFSVFYRRFLYFNLGFELITFITIIICFAYHPFMGMFSSIVMLVFAAFITGKIQINLLIRIIVYSFLCLISFLMIGGDIVIAGKIITIIMNILFFFIYLFMYGFNPVELFPVFANIFINFLLFSKFAEILLSLIA